MAVLYSCTFLYLAVSRLLGLCGYLNLEHLSYCSYTSSSLIKGLTAVNSTVRLIFVSWCSVWQFNLSDKK